MTTTRTPARYSLARAYVAALIENQARIDAQLSIVHYAVTDYGTMCDIDTRTTGADSTYYGWNEGGTTSVTCPDCLAGMQWNAPVQTGTELAIVTSRALVPISAIKTERMTYTEPEPMKVPVIAGNTPTVAILSALDSALSIVRETNPNIPTALAVVISTGRGKFHGSFQASQWEDTNESGEVLGKRHELVMSSESLARGGKDTLVTLIHEAMHAQAHATGVKDTSRQGRFHNDKFRTLAEGAGLTCEKDSGGSTTTTGLQSWAERLYAPVIEALDTVLTTHRIKVTDKPVAPKSTVRVQCGCECPVTLPIKWYEDHGVANMICALCDSAGEDSHFYPID